MDLRIGIQNSPRELSFETSQTAAEVEQAVRRMNAVEIQAALLARLKARATIERYL